MPLRKLYLKFHQILWVPRQKQPVLSNGLVTIHSETEHDIMYSSEIRPTSWEAMYMNSVDTDIKGASLLDLGHAQINDLNLTITDTSSIILSGGSLCRFKK